MNKKLLALFGTGLLLTSCADDLKMDNNGVNVDPSTTTFNTAALTVGNIPSTRAAVGLDTWSDSHDDSWTNKLDFTMPSDAFDIIANPYGYDQSTPGVFVIPESFSGETPWFKFADGSKVYVKGKVDKFNANNDGTIDLYIDDNASIYFDSSSGTYNIYNKGDLTINKWTNINNLYNSGDIIFDDTNPYWNDPDGMTIDSKLNIYSLRGTIEFARYTKLDANVHSHTTVVFNEGVEIKNDNKYICGMEVNGKLTVLGNNLKTSYLKADEIEFDGHTLNLLPQAYVYVKNMVVKTSGVGMRGYEGSHALVESDNWVFENLNNFEDSFSYNIYFKANGNIKINEIIRQDNGQQDNVTNTYTAEEYKVSQNGQNVATRINNGEISGAPACGENYGPQGPGTTPPGETPVPPTPENGPVLVKIGFIESPLVSEHDHDADKTEGNRRLSATSIDFQNGVFYVSYHMRGGFESEGHWGGDTFDNDGVEGCIETWRFNDNGEIELGQYMWTYEFDFNHILLDGDQIITVGHRDDKGAIIGKIQNVFANFNAGDGTYSEEFHYRYLTTAEKDYGDVYNPNQGTTTEQWIGYKDAGDGNCVIKVGNEYWVATYAGYGRLDSDFNRIMEGEDNVAFQATPGSAKYIIDQGSDVAVLYLNNRPDVGPDAQSDASIDIISKNTFPFGGSAQLLNSYISPVDGKNMLAWDSSAGLLLSCMGRGGLNVNNEVYNFGEEGFEPVNGVAFDNNYIYVASGSHLRVLDKSNPENEIANYTIPEMSANFIKVVNYNNQSYIAVAFGQAGIQVFKLVEA